ncbi:unnamed protein product, partial [Pleuronectes platessa]
SGTPSLSSNVTVNVFILDQNDNAPVILYPVSSNGSAEGVEEIPRNVNPGHLVTKVRAYDADIGYNGWLLFSLQEVTDHSLFGLDRYTGQIRTLRSFTETDEAEHKLLILVKDNGNVSLSATATVIVKVVEPKEAFAASDVKSSTKAEEDNNVTFYLMITVGSVSALFLVSIIVLISMQCSKSTDYTSKYLPEPNYDGTLCHSIQYRSGDKRYMLVGPRMSIGSTIAPGSHANTLMLPDRRSATGETMEQSGPCSGRQGRKWISFVLALTLLFSMKASGQMRYSISEEIKEGTAVGNIAKDLGIDPSILKARGFRIVSGSTEPLFQVNQNDGILYVNRKIDREEICQRTSACLINLKSVLENPLEIHYVAVEVLDVNDHSPSFPENNKRLEISESTLPGTRITDLDAGVNGKVISLVNGDTPFTLTPSIQENMYAVVTKSQLDREKQSIYDITVTAKDAENGDIMALKSFDFDTVKTFQFHVIASDSGTPSLSSNVTVNVFILDQNDNAPVILYPVSSNGSAEGVEEIPRNVNAGHLVTKVRAYDADIGYNGWLLFSLQEVTDHSLFGLDRYTGQIRTLRSFTETDEAEHKLLILVKDNGNVSLSATATVIVKVVEPKEAFAASDVKSSTKAEEDSNVTFYLMITVGSVSALFLVSIIVLISMQCSKSTDYTSKYLPEPNYDGTLCHSIQYRSGDKRYMLVGPRMSIGSTIAPGSHANTLMLPDRRGISGEETFFEVNPDSGALQVRSKIDREELCHGSDSGTPSLSSNVTVNVFILDQNDNAPVILYPVSSNGSAEGVEEIPRNVNAGHLVTKVRAYDADIGYNGWLLFSLQEVTDHSLFGLDRYTGQIRTLRSFTETDEAEHKLLILVKDNGNVSLSATATVIVKVVEPKEAFAASDVKSSTKADEDNNVTFYLMITVGSVSALFLVSIIVLISMQCSKSTDYTSKYLPEPNYDGTLCHSIQYRSGDKRYMLVGPRMSIGSTIAPGSHANTLMLPDRRGMSGEVSWMTFA